MEYEGAQPTGFRNDAFGGFANVLDPVREQARLGVDKISNFGKLDADQEFLVDERGLLYALDDVVDLGDGNVLVKEQATVYEIDQVGVSNEHPSSVSC